MLAQTTDEIKEMLSKYRFFGECIIEEFRWTNFGTSLVVVFNYIFDAQGRIRKNLSTPLLVAMQFDCMQRLYINNGIRDSLCQEIERINWGWAEVAGVDVDDHSPLLATYVGWTMRFHSVTFSWEGKTDHKIRVVFARMSIKPISVDEPEQA